VAPIRASLLEIAGIQSVEISELTGSILVTYDCRALSLKHVWSALARLGCVQQQTIPNGPIVATGDDGLVSAWARHATKTMVEVLAQKVVEISVIALIRAVI
jgi:hypothetical protein